MSVGKEWGIDMPEIHSTQYDDLKTILGVHIHVCFILTCVDKYMIDR